MNGASDLIAKKRGVYAMRGEVANRMIGALMSIRWIFAGMALVTLLGLVLSLPIGLLLWITQTPPTRDKESGAAGDDDIRQTLTSL